MAPGGQQADETKDGDFTHGPESLLGLVWAPVKELKVFSCQLLGAPDL